MNKQAKILSSKNLHHEFNKTNISLLLGLIIISLGLYIIYWIYDKNKEFELLDHEAPDSTRGGIIMIFLPFGWFFSIHFLKGLIFGYYNSILNSIEIFGWILIVFILLKYLLDFCLSFGNITNTKGIFWFIPFIGGFIGGFSFFLGSLYFTLFLIFPIIIILAMQSELNLFYEMFIQKKNKSVFYH